jgi:tRNA dimethylallyltransferase
VVGAVRPLVVIVGPTASGKSALALALGEQMGGEVVNYDSVQVYRGADIGSGKVSAEERARVPHHLLDVAAPGEVWTAGDFRRRALAVLEDVRSRGKLAILAGGTGLYLRALLEGLFEGPPRSEALRERLRRLAERRGRAFLHRMLARLDGAAAARIHLNDTQKVIRALEVCILARQPITALHHAGRPALEGYRVVKIGLDPPRDQLYQRINRRVELIFERGLVEETARLLKATPPGAAVAHGPLRALGYRQAVGVLEGSCSLPEAVLSTQLETRHYAKRQVTWFRRDREIFWFSAFGDNLSLQQHVIDWVRRTVFNAADSFMTAARGPWASSKKG